MEKLGKNHEQICSGKIGTALPRNHLQISKRFFEVNSIQAIWTTSSKHYSGFFDSENITEYLDGHITQNLKGTGFIWGKKATSLLITKDLEGTSFIGVGKGHKFAIPYVDEDYIFYEHKVLLKNLQNNFGT